MKKGLILFTCAALLAVANKARGQTKESLMEFGKQQQRTTKAGMLVLGSWAVGNFASSGLSLNALEGSRYYFHQMNILWNTVNITLAGIGYYQAARKDANSISLVKTVKNHHSLRRKLLFNAGLDVAYVVGGLYLLEKAKNESEQAERWQGYGRSVILQGAFLLTFDTVLYLIVRSQAESLNSIMEKLTISTQRVGLVHRF